MKRLLAALLAGAAVFSIAFASAAALNVNGEIIQAGTDINLTCDDSVNANWGLETDTNLVYNVRIDDISAACDGADLFAKVNGGPTLHTVIDSTSETLSFPTPMSPESINDLKVWIEG